MANAFLAALIHHHLPARAVSRSRICALFEQCDIRLLEITDQPVIEILHVRLHQRLWVATRLLLKVYLDIFFNWYSGRDPLPICIKRCLLEPPRLLKRLGLATREEWMVQYRTCLIEGILVRKHVSAWRAALAAHCDWLFVLEDDAQILPDTSERLLRLMQDVLTPQTEALSWYFDLAGGYPPTMVLPTSSATVVHPDGWTFGHVRTNTTCAYVVSKALMGHWLLALHRHRWLFQLPADHLINIVSIFACRRQSDCSSRHWQQPFFQHGSFESGFGSSISAVR